MKNYVAIGLVLALFVLGGVYLALHARTTSNPSVTSTAQNTATTVPATVTKTAIESTPAVTSVKPVVTTGTITKKVTRAVADFEHANMVTTDSYPTLSGTANVQKVGIILYNSQGTGLVSTDQIIVENGHWSYSTSVMLTPDTYTVELYGGARTVRTTLEVK